MKRMVVKMDMCTRVNMHTQRYLLPHLCPLELICLSRRVSLELHSLQQAMNVRSNWTLRKLRFCPIARARKANFILLAQIMLTWMRCQLSMLSGILQLQG